MDLFEILDDYDVEFWTEGKNVSKGHINIQCPYCDDDSNHLGIRLSDLRVNCWRCGPHAIIGVLQEVIGCTFREAKQIRNSISVGDVPPPLKEVKVSSAEKVALPDGSTYDFPDAHIQYLRDRGFTAPKKIIKKYKLRAIHNVGDERFLWRIIIPIIMKRQIVGYTSRTISDEQKPKYRMSSPEESIVDPKQAIYNYDTLTKGGDCIIVEGPVDVWKMGDNTVSFLGVKYTQRQLVLLKRMRIRRCFIMFDADKTGQREGYSLARFLRPMVKHMEVISLEGARDPGELTLADAGAVKSALGISI